MKKFSIILNIALILISLFFAVFANLKSKEASKQREYCDRLAKEAVALQKAAEKQAANAREAEARAQHVLVELEACRQSQR